MPEEAREKRARQRAELLSAPGKVSMDKDVLVVGERLLGTRFFPGLLSSHPPDPLAAWHFWQWPVSRSRSVRNMRHPQPGQTSPDFAGGVAEGRLALGNSVP